MNNAADALKRILSLLVIFGIVFFFLRAFQVHWAVIRSYPLRLDFIPILFSCVLILLSCLLSTLGFFLVLNSLFSGRRITFCQSIAAVNTSGLMKYIPGKVWSYALQMYWLIKAGFSKSLILYANLINLYVSVISSVILGVSYLVLSAGIFPVAVSLPVLLLLVILDFYFIRHHQAILNRAISLINRFFRRDIRYFEISNKLIVRLYLIHFAAAACFGLCAWLMCPGIGFKVEPAQMLVVMSSFLISDVIGFMAFMVPGGLGVREGVMYLMLNSVSTGVFSLVLPIAIRIVNMLSDIIFGLIAFALLRYYK